MKITAKASGGFAGRTECYELDTSCRANGKSVESLLHQLDFFGAAAPSCGIGADMQRWEITVDDGPRRRTVTLTEDPATSATGWHALLEHLRNSG
ncbi:MAG: protealysin inhibitor emfourin [Massilia sp.]